MNDSGIEQRVPLIELRQGIEYWWVDDILKQQRAATMLALALELEDKHGHADPNSFGNPCFLCELTTEWRQMAQAKEA